MTTYKLTKDKYDELEEELETLKTEKRREVAESLEHAKSLGDLSENAEYHEARAEQARVEDRIKYLTHLLKTADIVKHTKKDEVEIGSEVKLRKKNHQKKQTYKIVGSEASNLKEGKVSHDSPLGKALMGAKKGDKVTVKTPTGEAVYHVEAVK